MTDDDARMARIAELKRRRASGAETAEPAAVDVVVEAVTAVAPAARGNRSNRSGVASGSKIAATGIGFTAMLGLVAAMGLAERSSQPEPQSQPVATVPTQVVIVVHEAGAAGVSAGSPAVVGNSTVSNDQPVVLTAQPVVRQAPASQAPAGRTNGSR
ncbi:MAG: hypothetical protein ACO3SP_05585 [Ilumatobacteraceae bacterium]